MANSQTAFVITTDIDLSGYKRKVYELQNHIAQLQKSLANISMGALSGKGTKEVTSLERVLTQVTTTTGKLAEKTKELDEGTHGVAMKTKAVSSAMEDVGRRVFMWGALSAAIFGVLQNMKDMYTMTINLNSSMAELKKVMPRTEDFAFLNKQAFKLGIEFGASPEDAMLMFTRFAQAGLDAKEAMEATRTALLAVNTTGADAETVFDALIGAARIFGISFEDSGRVIDKVQRIQADYAVSAKDLITSITAIGPAITQLNGNIDDLFGNVAILGEAARISGKEASNSLKRVLSRIPSEEGIKALQDMGVAVMKTTDDFRPLRDIMTDLSKAMSTASDVEKQRITMILAQVRQYPKLVALLNNYDDAIKAIEISERAVNDANLANQLQMQSYSKRLAVASARNKEFAASFIESNIVPTVLALNETMGGFASILSKIPSGITSTVTGILGLVAALKLLSFMTLGADLAQTKYLFNWRALKATVVGAEAYITRTGQAIKLTAGVMSKALGVIGLLSIAATALYVVWDRIFGADLADKKRRIEELAQSTEAFVKSLKDVNIPGIGQLSVTDKFNALEGALIRAANTAEKGGSKLKVFQDAMSELLYNKPSENLLETELANVNTQLEKMYDYYQDIVLLPYKQELTKIQTSLSSSLQGIGGKITVEGMEEQLKAFDEYLKALKQSKGVGGYNVMGLAGKGAGFYKIKGITDIDKLRTSSGELYKTFKDLVKVGRELSALPRLKIEEYAADASTSIYNTILKIRELQEEFSKLNQITQKDLVEENQKKQNDAIDETAEKLLKLVDLRVLYNKVQGLPKEWNTGSTLDDISKRMVTENIIKSMVAKLQEKAATTFSPKQAIALGEALKEVVLNSKKASEGVFTYELSVVSLIGAMKESSISIMSSFFNQMKSFTQIGAIADNVGASYDVLKKKTEAVDASLTSLITKQANNEAKLLEIEKERAVLQAVAAKGRVVDKGSFLSEQTIKDVEERIDKLALQYAVIKEVTIQDRKYTELFVAELMKLKTVLDTATAVSKKYASSLETQFSAYTNVIGIVREMQEASVIRMEMDDVGRLEKYYQSILELDILREQELGAINNKTEAEVEASVLLLKNEYERDKLLRLYSQRLNEVKEAYDGFKADVDDIRNIFKDLLTDQESFINLFSTETGWKDFLKKGFGGITNVILSRDAETITKAMESGISKMLKKTRDDIQGIDKFLADIDMGSDQATALFKAELAGAELTGKTIYDSFLRGSLLTKSSIEEGFRIVELEVFPRLAEMLMDSVSKRQVEKMAQVAVDADRKSGPINLNTTPGWLQGGEPIGGGQEPTKQIQKEQLDKLSTTILNAPDTDLLDRLLKLTEGSNNDLLESLMSINHNIENSSVLLENLLYMPSLEQRLSEMEKSLGISGEINTEELKAILDKYGAVEEGNNKQFKDSLIRTLGLQGGNLLGGAIAKGQGKDTSQVDLLSNMLFTAGSMAGNPLVAAIGGAVGGVLGGFFGGDTEEEKQTQKLTEIEQNTAQLVDILGPQIINAPANFSLPAGQGYGSNSISITNNITVKDSKETLDTLGQQIEDLYNRKTKRFSNLR